MAEQKNELVEAIEEGVKDLQEGAGLKTSTVKIEFGSLREKVKKGHLDPVAVLSWYRQQKWQYSKSFVTFLKNQRLARKRKTEEVKRKEAKKESNDKQEKGKGKPRRRKRKTTTE